jgi:hypothetical protein
MYKKYRIKTFLVKAISYNKEIDLKSFDIYDKDPKEGDMIFEAPFEKNLFLLYTKERFDSLYELLNNDYNKDTNNSFKEYRKKTNLVDIIEWEPGLTLDCSSCESEVPNLGDVYMKTFKVVGENPDKTLILQDDHMLIRYNTFIENFELEQ